MISIYLIRHGETIWNKSGKYQGSTDVPLNDLGLDQAKRAGDYLSDVPFTAVYASNLCRAKITAETIASVHGLLVQTYEGLQELHFGEWEGLTFDEIDARWPGEILKMYEHPDLVRIAGGETFLQLQQRAMATFSEIVANHEDGDTIALVCHGATNRMILCALLDIPIDRAWLLRQENTAVNLIWYQGLGKRNWLALLNSTIHLKGKY